MKVRVRVRVRVRVEGVCLLCGMRWLSMGGACVERGSVSSWSRTLPEAWPPRLKYECCAKLMSVGSSVHACVTCGLALRVSVRSATVGEHRVVCACLHRLHECRALQRVAGGAVGGRALPTRLK